MNRLEKKDKMATASSGQGLLKHFIKIDKPSNDNSRKTTRTLNSDIQSDCQATGLKNVSDKVEENVIVIDGDDENGPLANDKEVAGDVINLENATNDVLCVDVDTANGNYMFITSISPPLRSTRKQENGLLSPSRSDLTASTPKPNFLGNQFPALPRPPPRSLISPISHSPFKRRRVDPIVSSPAFALFPEFGSLASRKEVSEDRTANVPRRHSKPATSGMQVSVAQPSISSGMQHLVAQPSTSSGMQDLVAQPSTSVESATTLSEELPSFSQIDQSVFYHLPAEIRRELESAYAKKSRLRHRPNVEIRSKRAVDGDRFGAGRHESRSTSGHHIGTTKPHAGRGRPRGRGRTAGRLGASQLTINYQGHLGRRREEGTTDSKATIIDQKVVDLSPTKHQEVVDLSATKQQKVVDLSATKQQKVVDLSATKQQKVVDLSATNQWQSTTSGQLDNTVSTPNVFTVTDRMFKDKSLKEMKTLFHSWITSHEVPNWADVNYLCHYLLCMMPSNLELVHKCLMTMHRLLVNFFHSDCQSGPVGPSTEQREQWIQMFNHMLGEIQSACSRQFGGLLILNELHDVF